MIEKIIHNKKLLSIIIRSKYKSDGIEFFTPGDFSQQLGYMHRKKNHMIPPHTHNIVKREVSLTQEVIVLKSGKVFAYGLDVYNGEPKIHPEYLKLKNIFLLPHLGSATKRTRWDMGYRATENLEDYFKGKKPKDLVN